MATLIKKHVVFPVSYLFFSSVIQKEFSNSIFIFEFITSLTLKAIKKDELRKLIRRTLKTYWN
jgi:hypothetical protein